MRVRSAAAFARTRRDGRVRCFLAGRMAQPSGEDAVVLQAMLRQLFQSVKEKITGAPSLECAEEILVHLEETDENFHK